MRIKALLLTIATALLLWGCPDDKSAEEVGGAAGRKIDEAQEAVEEATEKMTEKIEKITEAVEE